MEGGFVFWSAGSEGDGSAVVVEDVDGDVEPFGREKGGDFFRPLDGDEGIGLVEEFGESDGVEFVG